MKRMPGKLPKILFLVQLPPPVHGVTVMNQYAVNNPAWEKRYRTRILPLSFGQSLNDIGKVTVRKLFYLTVFLFRLLYAVFIFRPSLVYFTIMPTGKMFYRDAFFTSLIKLSGAKIVFHLHGKGISESVGQSTFKKWLYKRTFRKTHIISLSGILSRDLLPIYEKPVFILPNGIPVTHYSQKPHSSKVPVIVYLSNLIKSKGIEIFLQSLVELQKKGVDFHAKIIGGPFDFTLEDVRNFILANNLTAQVIIYGPLYGKEKTSELFSSDIFVLPSFNEAFPLTILEAMNAGLAIVVTSVGGIPDMIEEGTDGLLIEPGNVADLTVKLEQLLTSQSLRERIGNNAKNKFMKNYTIESFRYGLSRIFSTIMKEA